MGKNNRKPSFPRKNPRVQFDKRGSFKKSKRQNSSFEKGSEDFSAEDTVYRILCPVKKIGSVIGKGGDIIKRLREETHAKIKVGEPVPGTDERVVIVFSSSTKEPKISENSEHEEPEKTENPEGPEKNENQEEPEKIENQEETEKNDTREEKHEEMEPHCPAQHALLKVHERIAQDDGLFGGPAREENNEEDIVTARLLVPSNQVGCLLGKGGHVIQKLRNETGANIRILPEDHLPPCAMRTDELVQISGISAIAKKALYVVSTLLYQNPRPPMKNPVPSHDFYPPEGPMGNMPPRGHPMSHWDSGFRGPPPMPWGGDVPRFPHGDASADFSMKILCPSERIGSVIGRGGSTVRQIQHETGTNIKVEETRPDAEERAILVSALDAPWNPISPTIEAILLLQVQTNVISADGTITTRLLVPSSKVGCLLGQGGHIINEMRRRTRADIRVFSKDGKPDYASPDEELVQVSGNVNVARDALAEVASRLRMRSLEGINGPVEPGPPPPFNGFGRSESFPERRRPPPGMTGGRSYGHDEHMKGGRRDFEPNTYPDKPVQGYNDSRFPKVTSSMQIKIPHSAINSVLGSNISNIGQMSGAKVKLSDPQGGGSECVVEIQGSFDQMEAAQNLLQSYISSSSSQSYQQAPHSYAQPQLSPYASSQQQNPYGSSTQKLPPQQHHQSPYASSAAAAAPSSQYPSAAPSSQYPSAAPSSQHYQSPPYGGYSAQQPQSQSHQSPYSSGAPSYGAAQQQKQSSYGSSVQSYGTTQQAQQNQSPYATAAVPNYNSSTQQQQQQQVQQTSYASSAPSYAAYLQQQQQQSPYASAAQNYSVKQEEPSSYGGGGAAAGAQQSYGVKQEQSSNYAAGVQQSYEGQQQQYQQGPYQY
ncbi:hypothetical protein ACHQM5_009225 [Ranunculus cassubicifolius]